jgi:hypothetical protein
MCYYNGVKVPRDEYIRLKHLEKKVANYDFLDRTVINGFDFGTTAIIKPTEDKKDFEIGPMEWGEPRMRSKSGFAAKKFAVSTGCLPVLSSNELKTSNSCCISAVDSRRSFDM